MTEDVVRTDSVEIATQAFGDPTDPPVLLVMGAMASMLWWPEEFCRQMAARGLYVIRYDNRDTGLSTTYEPGKASYSKEDMADDALNVLDAYGISRAHIVGMSLGGTIAQIAAFRKPDRIATLTLISTWAVGIDTSHLPGMTDAYMAHGAEGETIDWTDPRQVIDYVVKDTRMIASTVHAYDEERARALLEADFARARNFVSGTNHFTVSATQDWTGRLEALAAPLLVIHGSSDPLCRVEHGKVIAETVPGSRFVVIEGGGHEIHPADWSQIIGEIADHTGST